ncbi:MAG: RecX family transcriptional regulator [Nitrospirae bacterium]|nr:RecX family transcriptional regulator [Nitrospirota bacterium]
MTPMVWCGKRGGFNALRQRLWRTLERRGFSSDVIHKVIKTIEKNLCC